MSECSECDYYCTQTAGPQTLLGCPSNPAYNMCYAGCCCSEKSTYDGKKMDAVYENDHVFKVHIVDAYSSGDELDYDCYNVLVNDYASVAIGNANETAPLANIDSCFEITSQSSGPSVSVAYQSDKLYCGQLVIVNKDLTFFIADDDLSEFKNIDGLSLTFRDNCQPLSKSKREPDYFVFFCLFIIMCIILISIHRK